MKMLPGDKPRNIYNSRNILGVLVQGIQILIAFVLLTSCAKVDDKEIKSGLETNPPLAVSSPETTTPQYEEEVSMNTSTPQHMKSATIPPPLLNEPTTTLLRTRETWTPPSITSTPLVKSILHGRIAFISHGPADQLIEVIDITGENRQRLTDPCMFCSSVSWSPDGHWIAFQASFETYGNTEIYIVKADGSEMRRLTFGSNSNWDVAWSPDGEYIAYSEAEYDWSNDICLVRVEDGQLQKLFYTPDPELFPAWSPDGKQIAFLRFPTNENSSLLIPNGSLMVMDADGKNIRQVTDFTAGIGKISWSPDGKRIAFSSSGDCGDIYTIGMDGSDLRQLTDMSGCANYPTWSPDGKQIAFISSDSEVINSLYTTWDIYIMNSDGSDIHLLAKDKEWIPVDVAWAPVPALQKGKDYQITAMGTNLNLRDEHSLKGKVLTQLLEGDIVKILEGPMDSEGYYWWRLRTTDGVEGWAVELAGWYELMEE